MLVDTTSSDLVATILRTLNLLDVVLSLYQLFHLRIWLDRLFFSTDRALPVDVFIFSALSTKKNIAFFHLTRMCVDSHLETNAAIVWVFFIRRYICYLKSRLNKIWFVFHCLLLHNDLLLWLRCLLRSGSLKLGLRYWLRHYRIRSGLSLWWRYGNRVRLGSMIGAFYVYYPYNF